MWEQVLQKEVRNIFNNPTSVPIVSCILKNQHLKASDETFCKVCDDAHRNPLTSKNLRRNTSLMIVYRTSNGDQKNIMIDCGKFFWQSALEWFPKYSLEKIDAILMTHEHNDACFGIDDLRDWTKNIPGHKEIPIYATDVVMKVLQGAFPYLVNRETASGGGGVSKLLFHSIDPHWKGTVEGLKFTCKPVIHGTTQCLTFIFGKVVYMSDVNQIPEDVFPQIQNCEILILDLLWTIPKKHSSHFNLEDCLENILKIMPQKTYFVGMNHYVDHQDTNSLLQTWKSKYNILAECAYDGMVLNVEL